MGCSYSSSLMEGIVYQVHADWDPEAGVWVATSDDVPGLATEAPTVEALTEKLRTMIPELLEANRWPLHLSVRSAQCPFRS
jgi:predicted RNase H-like HicB family nuclease